MGSITRSHSFVSGEKPTESEWNVDIDQLFTLIAGQIDTNNVDTTSSDGVSVLNANQTVSGTRSHSGALTMTNDVDLIFGTDSDIKIRYDETTDDALRIDTGVEGAPLAIVLKADQGDDAGDAWKVNLAASAGVLTFGNDLASKGTYVTQLTLTPHATVASSTTAIAGHATVGGDLTVTGGVTVAGASAFDIGDSDKLLLGDGDDLQIYHDGSNSYIANATGALKLATETSGIAVTIGHTTSETTIADNATVTGTLDAGASTLASLTCTAAGTFGGGYGDTGATISTTGVGQFNGALTTDGALTAASMVCTAAATFGGGFGDTGATISTAGVIQANGAITSDGAVTGATLVGTISTGAQNSITSASSLVTVGTITSGTWSGVIDGSATMTLGSDATGDVYYRDASGFLERLAAGADGYVLTSTGAGSIPAWEAAALGSSGGTSITTVGTIGTGVWQGTAVASAYLDADTAHLSTTQTFSGDKTFTGTVTVGVDDTGKDVKFFGATAGAYMEWDESADQLRLMGASADATTSTGKLLLATSLTDINANDVLGKIDFQAPHEDTGTDAIAIAASIQAVAQATFTATVNATDLIFYTGHSEAATEKFRMTSQGELGVGGANYGTDGQVLTSAGAGAAAAWEDAGAGTSLSGSTDDTIATVTGSNALQGEANLTFNSSNVLTVTGTADVSGDFTAGTVNADSDTAASDNAAMGYTAAEGLILTGQGSTNDYTIKNDADLPVIVNPTGLETVRMGRLTSNSATGEHVALVLKNKQSTATTDASVSLRFETVESDAIGQGSKILVGRSANYASAANLDDYMSFWTMENNSESEKMRIHSTGHIQTGYAATAPVTMNDGLNALNDAGLTIMQDAHNDEILTFKSSDVTHGMTSVAGANTYGLAMKISGTAGGLMLRGLGSSTNAIAMQAHQTTNNTAKSTTGYGAFDVDTYKKTSGTTSAAMDADANLMTIRSSGTTRFIFDTEGSGHADVEWTTYSDSRLKKNVIDCPYGLAEVLQLEPKTFDKHSGKIEDGEVVLEEKSRRMIGFLAQDVKALMPELVKDLPDDQSFYSLNDGKLAAVLVNAIQELNAKLEAN